jgi:glycyl-tRNA synthetase
VGIPFTLAFIGRDFRNKITIRSGLLRQRGFTMAEIKHYMVPGNKTYKKLSTVKDMKHTYVISRQTPFWDY